MGMVFRKFNAQGNDYIIFDLRGSPEGEENYAKTAVRLSDHHFGIGSDGLVLLLPSFRADARMRMFNADGSEGRMCGSALRMVIQILLEEVEKDAFLVETVSGIKRGWQASIDGQSMVSVSLGTPRLIRRDAGIEEQLSIVDTGNMHQVRYLSDIDDFDIKKRMGELLPQYEGEEWNYEFVEIDTIEMIRVQVWEHGSGETLACGTGAAASVFAGWETGKLRRTRICVEMPGGRVYVEQKGEELILSGVVEEVFRGELVPFDILE